MAIGAASGKSMTFDEGVHATAGYSYWAHNDYRLNPENGNWPQRLIGLPLVLGDYAFPSLDQTAWHTSGMWTLSDQFVYGMGNDAKTLVLRGRLMIAFVGALLGLLVFLWSRHLFGPAGAWVSLVLFVFSPTMLAHGALATSDMTGAAFFIAAVWALWIVLHRITPLTLAASTVATSGLFLSKLSAPILVPIAIGMLAVRLVSGKALSIGWRGRETEIRGRLAQVPFFVGLTVAHMAVAFLLIWASFGFRYEAFVTNTNGQDRFLDPWSGVLTESSLTSRLALWGREHRVLPEAYMYGFASVVAYAQNRAAFLNGEFTTSGGWRWFFPYAALVKTTLPALLLLAIAPTMLVRRWLRADGDLPRRERIMNGLYAITPLLMLIGVYWAFALTTHLNIGHRHLLPVIPAAMVLAGAAGPSLARVFDRRRELASWRSRPWKGLGGDARATVARALAGFLLIWHAFESMRIAPHYLAYFNPLDGGPRQAYRHLVDSSLDWGQDLPGLKKWLDREGLQGPNHPPVYLSYFGTARPQYYDIDAKLLPGFSDRWVPRVPEPLTGGVYCISATMLQGVYLTAPGAWSSESEERYQITLANLRILESTANDERARAALLRQTGEELWWKVFHAMEQLRFARLAAHLRLREPDAQIGYSILIYRLADADVARALFGPPP